MRTPLETYHDVLDFLLRRQNAGVDERQKLLAQEAILSAYQELPLFRNWKYYYSRGRVTTDAAYDTGSIEYDHSGGSSERLLTLTDGVWPTNAARGRILINNYEYSIATRIDDTTATLSVNSNPGADVAAGTSYKWWRDIYPMPLDFRSADKIIDHNNLWEPAKLSPGKVLNNRSNRQRASEPYLYDFIADPDYVGAMALFLEPPPDAAYNFDFIYQRSPMPMRTMDYSTGTVTVSSTTVTGVGTNWNSDMVGSLIRLPHSGVDQVPTGLAGKYPYAEQRIITAVASTTSLTIDAVLSGTYTSATKYRISDYIDLDYHVMREAFRKLCEYRFSENAAKETQGASFRSFTNALTNAKEADGRRSFSYDCPAPVRYWNRLEQPEGLGVDVE